MTDDSWRDTRYIKDSDGHTAYVWQYTPKPGEHIRAATLALGTPSHGIGPGTVGQWADSMERYGHAITKAAGSDPVNHHLIGCGVGHDDAEFAETGVSMAAYYESGEAFGGPWWEDRDRYGSRKYYRDPLGHIPATRTRDGRPVRRDRAA